MRNLRYLLIPKIAVLVISCMLLFTGAEIVPRLLIHSNIEAFIGEPPSLEFAGWAYINAHHLVCSGSAEAFICTGVRVVEVSYLSKSENCKYPYTARVRAYTLFGIPYDTIVVDCNMGVYRLHHP